MFTPRLRDLLELSGFDNGVSATIIRHSKPTETISIFLKRLPVNSADHGRLFKKPK